MSALGRKPGQYTQLGRVLRIVEMLRSVQGRALSRFWIGSTLGVCDRTVRCDLRALKAAGIPVASVDGLVTLGSLAGTPLARFE